MRGRRIASGLFFAALAALLVWAAVTWGIGTIPVPEEYFSNASHSSESSGGDDVLFDDDSTVDWSDPFATDVFDSTQSNPEPGESEGEREYEFALTPQYFDALLSSYSTGLPLRNVTSLFSNGTVVLSGDADVVALSDLFEIPAALVIFLPDTVPCTLRCVPRVSEGRLTVSVTEVSAGSDVLTPYLSRSEILSSVEGFLNDLLTKYLPFDYQMRSARVTENGLYVRFSVG